MKNIFRIISLSLIFVMLASAVACTKPTDEDYSDDTAEVTDTEESTEKKTEKTTSKKPTASTSYTIKGYLLSASTPADTYGNGMSVVYKLSDGRLIVFDGGNGSVRNFLIEALQEIAGKKKPTVAAWIMTHDHGDHYGALIDYYYANASTINQVIEVEEFWMNPMNSEGYNIQTHLQKAFPNAKFRRLTYGEDITLDKIQMTVLCAPEVIPADSRNDVNTNSLVLMFNVGGKKILMTGDANEPAWDFMIKQQSKGSKYSLKCDYLQVPHHGVHAAGTAEGYSAASPRYLVIPSTIDLANQLTTSSNAKPSYELYKKHGIDIGSLKQETNNISYWFAGCYGKSGTQDIKCFFTYKGK